MKRFADKTVLVTGASSGIGAELVRILVPAGARVIGTARRVDRLQALVEELDPPGERLWVHPADLTVDGEIAAVVDGGVARFGGIDVVIANAGAGISGPADRIAFEDYRRQLDINVLGVLRTLDATRQFVLSSGGSVGIVGSVNSFLALPGTSAYSMSKFAIRGLADAIRPEYALRGASVTLVAPGFVDTEIRRVDNAGTLGPEQADRVPRWLRMPADVAARKTLRAIARRRREVVLTGHGKAAVFFARHFPGMVAARTRRVARRRRPPD